MLSTSLNRIFLGSGDMKDTRFVTFKAVKDDEQVVLGPVYTPNEVDTDGESMTKEDVQKMAYDFLSAGRVQNIDLSHNFEPCGANVVESFVARKGDPDFEEGAWILGVHVPDDTTWKKIKKGEINGFSFGGSVRKVTQTVLVEVTDTVKGITETCADEVLPIHSHDFFINYDDNGKIKSSGTSHQLGHSHKIKSSDSTELELGHGHRIIFKEE
jgi:hypothetical protein